MPKKANIREKPQKDHGLKVNPKAIRNLKTLKNEEAFYFYEAVGKPTGLNARNLPDFLEKVKSVKLESLLFHLQRGDFKNWIENALGDPKLAKNIEKIPLSHDERLRMKIRTAVESRLRESETSITFQMNNDIPVTV